MDVDERVREIEANLRQALLDLGCVVDENLYTVDGAAVAISVAEERRGDIWSRRGNGKIRVSYRYSGYRTKSHPEGKGFSPKRTTEIAQKIKDAAHRMNQEEAKRRSNQELVRQVNEGILGPYTASRSKSPGRVMVLGIDLVPGKAKRLLHFANELVKED